LWRKRKKYENKLLYTREKLLKKKRKRRYGEEETDKFKRIEECTHKENNVWRVRKKKGIIFMLIINHVNYKSFGSIAN
jgi:hypothetical protein